MALALFAFGNDSWDGDGSFKITMNLAELVNSSGITRSKEMTVVVKE
ncbi:MULTISPECIES: hypothetical protein [Paenibacillus]|nr:MULTISPECIES: hypothetical protein [Paenibacillus]MDH6427521.1 hypothetical protein [Paenibacillus sp. PastH-4]MDH6443551.1 hypothetical protein [Paenibacillus sp. PastF-4]MDH6525745.1 hypothetical protein [Paenibacillus sp. PastH-3]